MSNNNIKMRDELLQVISAHKSNFVTIGIFSAVINLLMLTPAIYMLQVYDRVLGSSNEWTLLMLTLIVLGLYLLMGALEWIRSHVLIQIGTRFDMQLNQRIYNAAYANNLQSSVMPAGQVLNDLTTLRQFATGNAIFAIFDIPWFPVYLLIIFLFHPLLGLLALAGALVLMFIAWLSQYRSKTALALAGKLANKATQQASNQLRNAETIEAMGMLANIRQRWLLQHYGFLVQQNKGSEIVALFSAYAKYIRMALQSLVLGLGALLVIDGSMTSGMMIAGSILMGRVLLPIDQLIGAWKQWSPAKQAYDRLNLLLSTYPEPKVGMELPPPKGMLTIEQIVAAPPNITKPTLHTLNFTMNAGETLGIIGASGSGKSTLARLLVGIWQPLAGKIRLDGANLKQWDRGYLGNYIGYLPQDIQLFAGTISENICRFANVDASAVVEAAEMAGVHELILNLPQGYDTLLGDGGAGLSGGQRQRIALARALYRQPTLIVLDEPNANLDEAGDQALLEAIKRIKAAHKTLVLITHRSNVLSLTDKLLVLAEGQLKAYGNTLDVLKQLNADKKPTEAAVNKPKVSYAMGFSAMPSSKVNKGS